MIENKFAIVITAYNRPDSLEKLLKSLNEIYTYFDIPLIISIDNNGTNEVNRVANEFEWKHGTKEVIIHTKKLGLRAHFIWAGDQTYKYSNVLFLEDDLFVSPYLVDYVVAVLDKYEKDDRIAGGSLYNPVLCEFDKCKFYQYEDGYDNYFFAHPYWGNIWMKDKWDLFKQWLKSYEYKPDILPRNVKLWNTTSFKKLYIQYLAETERFIVYPRVSYVTNMGEAGLHSKKRFRQFQTSFQHGYKRLNLSNFEESESIYDIFFELIPELIKKKNKKLSKYDFTMDIRGLHETYKTEYVVTRRKVKNSILSFSNEMRPLECNLMVNFLYGKNIHLAKAEDVIFEKGFENDRFVDDVLNANYHAGIKEMIACLKYVIKEKYSC